MDSELDTKDAKQLLTTLQRAGITMQAVAEKMDERVSWRTLYRWAKGEHAPQRASDLKALRIVAKELLS